MSSRKETKVEISDPELDKKSQEGSGYSTNEKWRSDYKERSESGEDWETRKVKVKNPSSGKVEHRWEGADGKVEEYLATRGFDESVGGADSDAGEEGESWEESGSKEGRYKSPCVEDAVASNNDKKIIGKKPVIVRSRSSKDKHSNTNVARYWRRLGRSEREIEQRLEEIRLARERKRNVQGVDRSLLINASKKKSYWRGQGVPEICLNSPEGENLLLGSGKITKEMWIGVGKSVGTSLVSGGTTGLSSSENNLAGQDSVVEVSSVIEEEDRGGDELFKLEDFQWTS